jgi:aspartate kinase
MKVFKFGGASVRDAEAFKNVLKIIKSYGHERLWIVVSAIGKTTNLLEELHHCWRQRIENSSLWDQLFETHQSIAHELKIPDGKQSWRITWLELLQLQSTMPTGHFDQTYDQWVSYGEILSTQMLSDLCTLSEVKHSWSDARTWLMTDKRFRDARVNWEETQLKIRSTPAGPITITQGFIGCSGENTTTLGREGSDYTAAIIANVLDAEEVIIWKDVPGMLNADPKKFPNAVFIPELTYQEALELAYYGASVIHPKTIQPLKVKNIPLNIRSFIHPEEKGTTVHENCTPHYPVCTIVKENQTLLSVSTQDGSFIVEDNIQEIFHHLIQIGIKVQLMENSALSFSICIQAEEEKIHALFQSLQSKYGIRFNHPVTLVTLRHYQESDLTPWMSKNILLEQKNRSTVRWILES